MILLQIAEAAVNDPAIDWLTRAGSLGILSFAVIAFMRGWICSGASAKERLDDMRSQKEEMKAQRDKALELVYKQADLAQRALEVGDKR